MATINLRRLFILCLLLQAAPMVSTAGAAKGDDQLPARLPATRTAEAEVEATPLTEWLGRLNDDKLSPEQITLVVTQALQWQADNGKDWDGRWGDFIQIARKKGKLSAELWRQYLLGAMRIKITAGTEARRSEGLPIKTEIQRARVGSFLPPVSARGHREDDLSGIPLESTRKDIQYEPLEISGFSGSGCVRREDLTKPRYALLKPGPQTYHYRYYIEVFDGKVSPDKLAQAKPLGERIIEGTIPWRLLAEDEPPALPSLRADEALYPAIKKSIGIPQILRDTTDTTLVEVMIQVGHPPAGMAFDMVLRAGDDTWPLGPVAWSSGRIAWWAYDTDLPESIQNVDIVLTPSPLAAARLKRQDRYNLIDLTEIWDGPAIVLSGIKVRSQQIGMIRIPPPALEAAREYAFEQLDQTDAAAQQLKRDGDVAKARAQLQRVVQERPDNIQALYNLGCLAMAEGDGADAMKCFADVQRLKPASLLRQQTQRQLRRLCAMYLYQAEKENSAAMCALGTACERGWGVKANPQEAKRWYRNAANAGHAEAMCRLAAMYEHETGATVNTDQARQWYRAQTLEWYRKAADLGNEEAKLWLSAHQPP